MEENKVVTNQETVENNTQTTENASKAKGNRPMRNRRNLHSQRKEVVKEYEEKVVKINRVNKVVKGGKRMKFSSLVVIGNNKGKYGFGTGKSGEVPDAIKKSVERAKRSTFAVKMVKGNTISHEVIGKYGATKVYLKPAPKGTGIIAGGAVRAVLELAGIQNVYSKVYGSRTPINVIRATHAALASLKNYRDVESLRKGGSEDVK